MLKKLLVLRSHPVISHTNCVCLWEQLNENQISDHFGEITMSKRMAYSGANDGKTAQNGSRIILLATSCPSITKTK